MTTSQSPTIRRIDCHHHISPASVERNEDKIGWLFPKENLPWSPEVSLRAMDALDIEMAILSYPPGHPAGRSPDVVRESNQLLKDIHDKYPDRFGFFATCLGDLKNIDGVLGEVDYAFDVLGANGISLTSSYKIDGQAVYPGDDAFDPLWRKLDNRKAAVFLHGSTVPLARPHPHAFLGIPVVEVPNETYKAAAHLVVTGKKRKYPNIKFILSHFGGSTPFLAPRVAGLSHHMGCSLTPEEIIADFKTFYYDTALSTYDHTLIAMKAFVGAERIVYGSDFPAISEQMVSWYSTKADEFYGSEEREAVMRTNILRLLSNMKV